MTEMLQTEPEENIGDIIMIIQTVVKKEKTNKTIPRQKPELRELIDPLLGWIRSCGKQPGEAPAVQRPLELPVRGLQLPAAADMLNCVQDLIYKTIDYCKHSAPATVPMLHFLNIILGDLKIEAKLVEILLEFLPVFCNCIPNNIHDEIFQVLNQIIGICGDHLTGRLEALDNSLLKQLSSNTVRDATARALWYLADPQQAGVPGLLLRALPSAERSACAGPQQVRPPANHIGTRPLPGQAFFRDRGGESSVREVPRPSHHEEAGLHRKLCQSLLEHRDSHVRVRGLEILRLIGEITIMTECNPLVVSRHLNNILHPHLESSHDSKIVFFSMQILDMEFRLLLPPDTSAYEARMAEVLRALEGRAGADPLALGATSERFLSVLSLAHGDFQGLRSTLQAKVKSLMLPLLLSLLAGRRTPRAGRGAST